MLAQKHQLKPKNPPAQKRNQKKRTPKQMLVKRTSIMMIAEVNVNMTPAIAAHQHPRLVGSR
ncbi:hypothetical protein ACTJIJ_05115 [Niabella sp. 22666]|uniref:hypothetical protein n=1 Tax=Niabella sp. 22666 TaxID=3453954 RepID=UPI003F84AACE